MRSIAQLRLRATFCLLALGLLAGPTPQAQDRAPKLVVIIVVDQMRAEYVSRFQKDWTGGFRRLIDGGAVFENAAYPYLTTVTCAGHATIATGSFPRSHGIIQNSWWDRKAGALMTCTEDPNASGVGYSAPIKNGDSAWRLQRPTLADVMRTERGARIVTLSLKDRSAVMLAGHGGDAVTWLNESLGGWQTASPFAEHPVPAVDSFVRSHPIRADFGKTWSRLLPADRYPDPDDVEWEAPPRGWTRTFPHVLNGVANAPDATFVAHWERSPFADAYLGQMAAALVDAFALGRHASADLLGVSFSSPDMVGHGFGPFSQEERDLYLRLDRTLGALFDHLDASVGRGRWVAALTADHGVTAMPEQLKTEGKDGGRIAPALIDTTIEDALRTSLGESSAVQVFNNDVYLAPGVFETLRKSPAALEAVLQRIRAIPGIARVFRSDELRDPAVASDRLQRAAALSYFPGNSGDLLLALKPGWIFAPTGATHGTANPDDQRVPLMLFGAGVKAGRYADAATPADVAPTLAAATGLHLANVDGRVLTAALMPSTR